MNIICSKCKIEKPETDFQKERKNKKTGRRYSCKMCRKPHVDAYNKRYNKAYREGNVSQRKAWYEINKARLSKYNKAYRANNKEIMKKLYSDYKKSHRDGCNVNNRKYKAIKRGNRHEPYRDTYIFERDGWICQICGRKINKRLKYPNPLSKSIDHIVPLSKGGDDSPANVQATHLRCNVGKNAINKGQLRLFG